jgi:hypothetical protein
MRRSKPNSKLGALFNILIAVAFNCLMGVMLGTVFASPVVAVVGAIATNAIGVAQNCARMYYNYRGFTFAEPAIFMDGLNKEVWIDQLIDQLRADKSFIEDGENWDEWVENDAINFAAVGGDPVVHINNTVWPLVAAPRTDTALKVSLDTFSSTPTRVQRIETAELVYNKLDSVNKQHVLAIMEQYGIYTAWNWGATANSLATPVIVATGAIDPATGVKIVLAADIAALAKAFDDLLYPDAGRTLLMSPQAIWSLINNDPKLTQQFGFQANLGSIPGVINDYYGFKIRKYVYVPTYRLVGGIWTKNAMGATPVVGTDFKGAIAYIAKNGIVRAWGSVEFFSQMNEPTYQADMVSYAVRAIARAKQQARIGVILQTT